MTVKWTIVTAIAICAAIATIAPAKPLRKEYLCARIGTPLKIDGKLDDWWLHQPRLLALVHPENNHVPDWRGPKDLEVVCYLLWSEKYLYFAAKVTDDKHVTRFDSSLWMADSFQVAFDPNNDSLNEPRYGSDDIEINFTASDPKHSFVWVAAHGQARWLGRVAPGKGVRVSYRRNAKDDGGIFEAALPWTMLEPIKPKRGKRFGFDVLYNESDGNGRRGWVAWTPGIGDVKCPWFFNNVRLVGENEITESPPFLVSKPYFTPSEQARFLCYIPCCRTDSPKAQVILEAVAAGQRATLLRKQLALEAGLNHVELSCNATVVAEPLTVVTTVSSPIFSKPYVLTQKLRCLSVAALKKRAAAIEKRNDALRRLIGRGRAKGLPTARPQVTFGIVGIFLKHRKEDLDNEKRIREHQLLDRIEKQFDYLETAIDRAINEVESLGDETRSARRLPVSDMMHLTIERGEFTDRSGRPVMLYGPEGWGEVFSDLQFYKEMGFNLVSDTITPEAVTPVPGQFRADYVNLARRRLRMARGKNMALIFLCSPHPTPKGWLKAYPDMKGNNGFINATYYSDGFRKMIEQYWGYLIPRLCDEPALLSWNMANEWFNFEGRPGRNPLHPRMRIRFHNYLREKYRDISRLNVTWQSSYHNFEEIDPYELHRASQPAAFYDWETFRNDEGLNVLKFFANTIRRDDSVTPLQVKIIADTDIGCGPWGAAGVEREEVDDVLGICGLDVGAAVNFNLLKSLHPNKPVMDTEVHTSIHLAPQEAVVRLWSTFLNGESGRVMWGCCNSYSATFQAAGAFLHIPWTLEAAARAGLDIQRLSPEIARFHRTIAEAQVGILYSPASKILQESHMARAVKVFDAISRLDAPVRFISEKQIAEDGLGALRILIAPDATFVQSETFEKVVRFVRSGRMLLATGASLTRNPCDKPYPVEKLRAPSAYSIGGRIRPEVFDWAFDRAGVNRTYRLVRTDGKKKQAIEARVVKEDGGILAYAINYGPDQTLTFNFRTPEMTVEDLISGRKLERTFPCASMSVMLLRVRYRGNVEFIKTPTPANVQLPPFRPVAEARPRKTLTEQQKAELRAIERRVAAAPHYDCSGSDDIFALGGQAKHRKESDGAGAYVWWSSVRIKPGTYRVFARLKADPPGEKVFDLCVVDGAKDQILKRMTCRASNRDYQEIEVGRFQYDGSFQLRLSDYSSPGLWVDYVYVKREE